MITLGAAVIVVLFISLPRARPFLGLIFVLLVEQELTAGGRVVDAGRLVTFGADWYYAHAMFGVPAVTAVGLAMIMIGWRAAQASGGGLPRVAIAAFALWVLFLGLSQGDELRDDVASAQSLIALLAGLVSARAIVLADNPETRRLFVRILISVAAVKGVVGLCALLLGQGPAHDGVVPIAFYDSVPLIVAAGVLAVAILDKTMGNSWRLLAFAAASLLALVSIRRASLVGAALVVLVCLLGTRRVSTVLRVTAVGALVGVLAVVLMPDLVSGAVGSVTGAIDGLVGSGETDASTRGHLRDNEEGLRLALAHPLEGVGVRARPTLDFVVREGDLLYVHNELLYAWLHFGLVGLALVTLLIAYSTVSALRKVRAAQESPPWALFGAGVLIAALPGYWFFPHLLTLDRFSFLIGWALGAVSPVAAVSAKSWGPFEQRVDVSGRRH